jgi:DNA helicase-2/ATP-dependent DNA helicase PcrA
MRAAVSRPVFRRSERSAGPGLGAQVVSEDGALHLGQRVEHPKFGEGVVLMYEGQGSHARVQVNFEGAGAKWLVVAYANLQTV